MWLWPCPLFWEGRGPLWGAWWPSSRHRGGEQGLAKLSLPLEELLGLNEAAEVGVRLLVARGVEPGWESGLGEVLVPRASFQGEGGEKPKRESQNSFILFNFSPGNGGFLRKKHDLGQGSGSR